MARTVSMSFKNPSGSLFISLAASLDIEYADDYGFVLSIDSDEPIVLVQMPSYVVFKYDQKGEPQVVFASNDWDDVDTFWVEERFKWNPTMK